MDPNIISWRNLDSVFAEYGLLLSIKDDKITGIKLKAQETYEILYDTEVEPNSTQIAIIEKVEFNMSYKVHCGELEALHLEIDGNVLSFTNSENELSLSIKHPRALNTISFAKTK